MNSKGQCSIESIYFNCPRANKQGFTVHKKRDFSIKLKKSYDGLFFHSNISKKNSYIMWYNRTQFVL